MPLDASDKAYIRQELTMFAERMASKEDLRRELDALKTEITKVKTDITEVKTEITGVKAEITTVKDQIGTLDTKLSARMDQLEVLIQDSWRQTVGVLQEDFRSHFKLLSERLDDYTLRSDFDEHVRDHTLHGGPATPTPPVRSRARRGPTQRP
jgi:chromosome segregation ATPase